MKFYNREAQLAEISNILSRPGSDLIYISGRRRIGKTTLILKALENIPHMYFFVGDKTPGEILDDFNQTLQKYFKVNYLKADNFKEVLEILFEQAKKEKIILVFDEFQNFFQVQKSIFADLQYYRDLNKEKTDIKIFCLGSHFSLMKKIFEDHKTPLRGRKTGSFVLKPFEITTQKEILQDHNLYTPEHLLYFYSIFFGIPKYIEILLREIDPKKDFLEEIIRIYTKENGYFLGEGKEMLILEFGKNSEIYFGILTAISLGKNTRSEIANFLKKNYDSMGIYLSDLEREYHLITRHVPITERAQSKSSKYKLNDLFLQFWFRYIYKNANLIEIKDQKSLYTYIKKDITTFLGTTFEECMKHILIQKNKEAKLPFHFEYIGAYRDKSGQNEIDIVAYSKKEKKVLFVECKIQKKQITKKTKEGLIEKAESISQFKEYEKHYEYFSITDIERLLLTK